VARSLQLGALGILERYTIREHSPYAASDVSEPDRDVAVVARQTIGDAHPQRAYLVVEVSDSSIRKDRRIKTGIYAAAGVPEYWIVDLDGGAVDVHRDPVDGAYRSHVRLVPGDELRPIELPGVAIAVASILPS
jgi:Uma2 family endonuclease